MGVAVQGDYDMHEDPSEGDFFERTREELLKDEENPGVASESALIVRTHAFVATNARTFL